MSLKWHLRVERELEFADGNVRIFPVDGHRFDDEWPTFAFFIVLRPVLSISLMMGSKFDMTAQKYF